MGGRVSRRFVMSDQTRRSFLQDLNSCGNLLNKLYHAYDDEYEGDFPKEIKELFSKVSSCFSRLHAKIVKLPEV